ncbi:MAG: 50S ribosomal protein L35 [Gammaproteobacteria bacterium RIFCSPLOWO2_02_FULL_56_15]|nr:MAG: 50S ribosomal protein L35 [Gammaproteobacteria bacterium RIFCSPLOWO2_02_FULL_56_15]
MPKMKTNRGAAKRFSKSASGKFQHRQSHRSHILTKKSSKRKRQLRNITAVHDNDQRAIARLVPYL